MSIAKIVEMSPIIGLTVVFTFVVYKIGVSYSQFVNKILEKYSEDVKELQKTINSLQENNASKQETIISKIDNFRQIVTQDLDGVGDTGEESHKAILNKIEELRVEVLRSRIGGKERDG